MNRRLLIVARALLALGMLTGTVSLSWATTITISTTQEGWWDSTGAHTASNLNYGVGDDTGNRDHRDFFVFNLSSLSGIVTSATLRIVNPPGGYSSPNASETLDFFDVTTPIATLLASGTGQVGIYADLGSGISYGSRSVSAADNNTIVSQLLNAAAVSAIQSALGSSFAIGGALTTLNQLGATEGMFLFTFGQTNQLVLEVQAVPEPTSVLLLGTGVFALARRRSRSKRHRV